MSASREQDIRKQYKRLKRKLPDSILNKPVVNDQEEMFLYNCFHDLCSERYPSDHAITAIPICKIYEYAQHLEVPITYHQRFVYVIKCLDLHYLKVSNDSIRQARRKK